MRFLITLAVLPGIAIIIYIYNLDKREKEPIGLLMKLTGLGALTVISAMLLEMLGEKIMPIFFTPDTMLYTAIDCFCVVAMSEEAGKYFVLKKFAWKDKNFDYMFDGIVYGVCVGLGFAIVENICYVLENGVSNAIMRAVTAVPGHATFGIYMGLYLAYAKYYQFQGDEGKSKSNLRKSFVVPVLLHGFYDFCLFVGTTMWILIFFVFIAILYFKTFKMIKKLSAEDKPLDGFASTRNEMPNFNEADNYSQGNLPNDKDYFDEL
ncbi:MAG: PrsW family intramembrane metalloprotease [Spirochaetales bacterium]|nr:PrsW family intramembrane metalloprotease [Spirochaetales bacterium]